VDDPFGGFSPDAVKAWRQREHDEGRPSSLNDFYRAHGLCATCTSSGKTIVGVNWCDASGSEQTARLGTEEAPSIAYVYDRYLRSVAAWKYLYESCSVCGGTGRVSSRQ
jgi:hypothetical protein